MDELVADAESAGRCGGLVWLAAGGAEGCKASTLLGDKGCETNGYNEFDKIMFWKTPVAEGGKFVPTAAGRRITSRLWAAVNRPEQNMTYAVEFKCFASVRRRAGGGWGQHWHS
jgi:putative spermidine/putrescine transport system substrate-binding protein